MGGSNVGDGKSSKQEFARRAMVALGRISKIGLNLGMVKFMKRLRYEIALRR